MEVLRSTGMSWTAIANCLGVSTKTLQRRRAEYNMFDTYSDVSSEELETNVRDNPRLKQFSGESYMRGALRGRSINVQTLIQSTVQSVGDTLSKGDWLTLKNQITFGIWPVNSNHKLISL